MCFEPKKKELMEAALADVRAEINNEVVIIRATGCGDVTDKYLELTRKERTIQKEIAAIPHRFEVGDGAHYGGNGDRYPVQVMSVSKSGKTIEVAHLEYAADKTTKNETGHQNWSVSVPADIEEAGRKVYTLRKNGRWVPQGQKGQSGWGELFPGAVYSYNWEF